MAWTILFFAGLSILLMALSIPMIRRRVKPNAWYGFRIPLTLNDPDIWYPANRYAGQLLLAYALVLLVVTFGLPFFLSNLPEESATDVYALSVAVVALAGLVPVVVLSLRYARKLAQNHESDDSH